MMRFKLDENFGIRTQKLFLSAGYDVKTVHEQNLHGCSDQNLYEICCAEKRCLLTLDLDFSDITRFPPDRTNGIVVFRIPRNPSNALLEQLIRQFFQILAQIQIEKKLLIVEIGRVRIHQSEEDLDLDFKEE